VRSPVIIAASMMASSPVSRSGAGSRRMTAGKANNRLLVACCKALTRQTRVGVLGPRRSTRSMLTVAVEVMP